MGPSVVSHYKRTLPALRLHDIVFSGETTTSMGISQCTRKPSAIFRRCPNAA